MGENIATRGALLAGSGRRFGTLRLPVCGLTVRFRSLSEAEMSAYEMASWTRDDEGNLIRDDEAVAQSRARLAVACLVDEQGTPLLTPADIPALEQLDAADLLPLHAALQRHCGMLGDPEKKSDSGSTNSATGPG